MEKVYSEQAKTCEVIQAGKATVDRLLQFSRTLHLVEYKDFTFEANLN
ncbi:hypothetical protein OZ410_11920 [Robiginitalea sp. M366]|nr:hypothetical protein [Robiginitalea aestuariiviva]MDG1573027.1 hypothetical protein [Robiginitalea aestuariiviva]